MTDETRPTPARLGAELGAENDQEAREFEDIAAQLGLAAEPVEPRPELKAALFAAIQTTPQLPAGPQTAPAPAQTVAPVPKPVSPAAPPAAPDATGPDAAGPAAVGLEAAGPAERKAQRRWFTRPVAIVASAAAAAALFFGGTVVGGSLAGNDATQQQASALAQINAAPDAQRASAAVTGGGTATLVWSAQLGTSALIARDLPNLPNDKTYELWYIRDGKATPAGTMDAAGTGSTWKVLAGTMQAGDTVGVTVEPSGGSPRPTTNPIVAIPS